MTDAHFARRPDTIATELPDGETALLDLASQRYYTLNGTGAWIWERLATPQTAEALSHALVGEYEVELAAARDGIAGLLDHLRREGLVVLS